MSAPTITSRSPITDAGSQLPEANDSPAAALSFRRALAIFALIAAAATIVGYVTLAEINAHTCHVSVCGWEGQ